MQNVCQSDNPKVPVKQPKVFAPEPPAAIPDVVKGPRYRYFSTPPKTVTIPLADLAAQIPAEARTAQFSEFHSVELPCSDILQGPVPKIRLSKLAEVLPEAVKTEVADPLLRLPVARLAANYRFINTEELIEDKPLPPLEPMPDFSSQAELADELDLPPNEFSPADLTFAPKDFTPPALVSPPPAPPATAEFVPPGPMPPPPAATAPVPVAEAPKPAKKPFSLLPMFRRKETAASEPEPPSPIPAPVESRPRVEIPKQRSVLPPITARVAEAAAAIPMQPAPHQALEPPNFTPSKEPSAPAPTIESYEEPEISQDSPPEAPTSPAKEEPPMAGTTFQPAPSEESAAVWVETEHLPKSPVGRSVEIPDQDGLQSVFMTEDVLSVERVLELSGGLPGIKSCILSHGSTVLASHNVPDTIDLVSLSANAVEMLKAMRQSVAKMGVGAIPAVTIHSEKGPITFFHQKDLCLLVLHKDRGFVPGVREKLQQVVTELARTNLALPISPVKPSLGE